MLNLAIIYGGHISEHNVSVSSYKNIYSQISKQNYNIISIFISKSGIWYYQDNPELMSVEKEENTLSVYPGVGIFRKSNKIDIDVAFLCLHGKYAEDGCIQGLLELCDIKYTGSKLLGSAITMNKHATKVIAQSLDIPVVPYMHFDKSDLENIIHNPKKLLSEILSLGFPLFLKPVSLGSSVGCKKLEDEGMILKTLEDSLKNHDAVLIEKFIEARELECSVLQSKNSILAPNVGEIMLDKQRFTYYDYDAKYIPQATVTTKDADIDPQIKQMIKTYSKRIFAGCFCSNFARVDYLMDVKDNKVYLSEINSIPGFTLTSLFARMCEDLYDYPKLIDRIILNAIGK